MLRLGRQQIQPIGVDIGHDSVKMLQLEVRGEKIVVHASGRRMIEPGADGGVPGAGDLIAPQAAQGIHELLQGSNFNGRSAVVALPRSIVHVKNLRLPIMPPGELASVIQFEARESFPFETKDAHLDYLVAGEIRQGTDVRQEVVVLAAQNTDVDRFAEQLHKTGLVLDSLDVEPCALYRTIDRFVRRREDELEVHVLIDVGMRCTQVLIGKGRDISFFKPIEIAGADFNSAVSRKLGIRFDEARALRRRLWDQEDPNRADTVKIAVLDATRSVMENLSREISLCLRYHSVTFRGQRPLKVRVGGGEGGDPQFLGILSAALSLPVEAARPLFSLDTVSMRNLDPRKPSGDWTIAIGLGLRRTQGKFAPMDGTPRSTQAQLIVPPVVPLAPVLQTSPAPVAKELAHA